ncbi:hypothetical protein SAMN05216464_101458 [Mucilaginibacter pineti]|uniref:Four helix bundle sensory module for signal transduction n=1 Tax=Mucilaginibacter pineti TaxID=1391627 RepID=A0A1G6TZY7_9SPHI|nr:hypothetical protein [Mucilaginibacter pineti]SDD33845.1 hypothetical protein SAMN05216464_101458 [Mucilaginibacter pineti]
MKKLVLLCVFCFLCIGDICAQSQFNADSVAYQLQRKKINDMLANRKLKFGQYSQSLNEHTGIFGFQTKSDIRRSNDILMDIAKTDDNIYKELKILLEYHAFQERQIESHSKEAESINENYLKTIRLLRQSNLKLKADLSASQQHKSTAHIIYIFIILLMLASILYLIGKKSKV